MREVAILTALDAAGGIVEQQQIHLGDFYEELHELIDSDTYRAEHGIVAIVGTLYTPEGTVDQKFRNSYAQDGSFVGEAVIYQAP